ncbi:MAG TPA: cytochrome c oxidase subunit 2A [bacterium]|nr:cytochrome c oxidase subunit 2A [bacterium]
MKNSRPQQTPGDDRHHAPQGTLALLLVYLVLIIVSWAGVYFVMLGRGVTR